MHSKFGVRDAVRGLSSERLKKFLEFRVNFLEEELNELKDNLGNPEEIVDACIDLVVVALGTLDAFGVNSYKAWDEVYRANMAKEVGIKPERPNPLGLPDLIKPTKETHGYDWVPPSHKHNYGILTNLI